MAQSRLPLAQGDVVIGDDAVASAIESILLVADQPVSLRVLARALDVTERSISDALACLRGRMQCSGIRLQEDRGSVQLVTAPENAQVVERFLGTAAEARLSRPALETLAIIAYRQPVTRNEIEEIRGVGSDRQVLNLTGRGLVEERGRRSVPGRPMEYGTTFRFLELFGLESLGELPALTEPRAATISTGDLGFRSGDAVTPPGLIPSNS